MRNEDFCLANILIFSHVFAMKKEDIDNWSGQVEAEPTDRKNMIQEYKNPIGGDNFEWIFSCNCEGTE